MFRLNKLLLALLVGFLISFDVAQALETVGGSLTRHEEQSIIYDTVGQTSNAVLDVQNWNEMIDRIEASEGNECLFLVFVYKENCAASIDLLGIWKRSIEELLRQQMYNLLDLKLPRFVTIPFQAINGGVLDGVSIRHAPTILFLKRDTNSIGSELSFSVLEYRGLDSGKSELTEGIIHYLSRLEYSGFGKVIPSLESSVLNDDVDALTVEVRSIADMEMVVQQHRDSILQHVPAPLDPLLSRAEQEWARFILDEGNQTDPLYVICQCRGSGDLHTTDGDSLYSVYAQFDQIASALSLRRNVVFCIHQECFDDGVISSYQMGRSNWSMQHAESYDSTLSTDQEGLVAEFCQKVLRPSVLWLDRQISAPIAFAPFYKLHAMLFVDFHHAEQKQRMRGAVAEFRRMCQVHHRSHIACLVVPSTDTRFLSTFGLDMWTQLDRIHTFGAQPESPPSTEVFPIAVITDQREAFGTKRFYLDDHFSRHSLANFFKEVMADKAQPVVKNSSNHNLNRRNSYGVHLLTGASVESFVTQEGKSKILLFYSPTCGHCKRFNVAWNALGELIEYIGLGDKLELGRLDVSANEYLLPGVRVEQLPDVYYFGFDASQTPTGYGKANKVGGISDPLDIFEWWVDVVKKENTTEHMVIDEFSLLQMLEVQRHL